MREIKLTKNYIATIDDALFNYIGSFKWCVKPHGRTFYAIRGIENGKNKRTTIYLHHLIMGYPLQDREVDHIDGNGLNNCRSNLRIVTRKEQMRNLFRHRNGDFLGIVWDKSRNKWQARKDGKFLGRFASKIEAIRRLK